MKGNINLQIYFQKVNSSCINASLACLIICLMFLFGGCSSVHAQRGSKIQTVVIDPGHGGRDPGALGKRSKEKDIVLDVALKTGEYIRKNLPDVKVIYTRSRDEFVELHRRAAIANENNADVFISIHCNSAKDSRVSGAETFVMGEHRTEANLEVAKLENAAILLEDNQDETYGGFDPNSTAAYIALSLFQSANTHQSIKLAQHVQEQFATRVGRKDRSVQQAGFLVLYRTTMPSILIELGFISNPAEEAFLISEQGKVYMASAIFRAFRDYKNQFEKENRLPPQIPDEWRDVIAGHQVEIEDENPKKNGQQSTTQSDKTSIENSGQIVYKVQFYTSPHSIPLTDARFKGLQEVAAYFHDGLYKYTVGSFVQFTDATQHQKQMQAKGFTDAFVVAFMNGKRIRIDQVKQSNSIH
ncbi:MAG: N-acetylmuramoyl-L-alanine amidase [Bacteroidales bacterium]|jgi:N-acetylmuramoyl-L-alanine amidase|nr:N-acetylmuramoyl-L-alanine amidase [Bacteroidales bacterium]MDD3701041.1 N-acetylmuramoyl-L-alanine amidase [Bacteroidales bacterium]MDY0369321.1 N-acetylmuramoyl-L-alanine amidase [Bacteroidales bacterium]